MYFVYVLKSKSTHKSYIGQTNNLKSRLADHCKIVKQSTKGVTDWKLIHTEEFSNRSLAIKREKFLKSGIGRRFLKSKGILISGV
ncbi:MAG: GIY-YIG nuclease family protein [Candidatus Omnitrophica bacterium]|nr:GIY-YIG nuclease family protein [Candidatus Omnitrophota bacterium]